MAERGYRFRHLPVEGFEPARNYEKNLPRWIDAKALQSLWDIAKCWGRGSLGSQVFEIVPVMLVIYDFNKVGTERDLGLFVLKLNEEGEFDLPPLGVDYLRLKNNIHLIWDDRLTTDEVNEFIECSSQWGKKRGLHSNNIRLAPL